MAFEKYPVMATHSRRAAHGFDARIIEWRERREGDPKAMNATQRTARCLVCERDVFPSLSILHAALCEACERELVESRPLDPDYDRFVERFRTFWSSIAEAAAARDADE